MDAIGDEQLRLRRQIERLVGGRVISLERQPRWRKAWYAVVEREGASIPIYVRGDKQIYAEPYPGLGREAAILNLFRLNDLPVPRVYGMTESPVGIVMDRVPGTRDVAEAVDDRERRSVAEQYIEVLARMHRLDTAPFVAAEWPIRKGRWKRRCPTSMPISRCTGAPSADLSRWSNLLSNGCGETRRCIGTLAGSSTGTPASFCSKRED
jgi:hypothetical protein